MRKLSRVIIVVAMVLLVGVVVVMAMKSALQRAKQRERAQWKTTALQQLAGTSLTNDKIQAEIFQLKNPIPTVNIGWAHEHVILMTNGQYLVYAYWHGANNGFVDHLFLARGTDGKWYYSTYHFCNSMAAIVADNPPGSIAEFTTRYAVREFDGKSDECLKHTFPLKP